MPSICPPRCLKMAALRAPREGMNPQRHLHGTGFLCCVPRLMCVSLVRRFPVFVQLVAPAPEFLAATPVPLPPYYYIHSILYREAEPPNPGSRLHRFVLQCDTLKCLPCGLQRLSSADLRTPDGTCDTSFFLQAALYVIKPCQ